MIRGNQSIKQGRDGSPSAPKPQARSAVPRGACRNACATKWDPCGEASLPFGFDWRCRADGAIGVSIVPRGRDGSPSGPKLQARSAVPCAVLKSRTPVSKNGTAVPKIGTHVPNFVTSVMKSGTAGKKFGTRVMNFRTPRRNSRTAVTKLGTSDKKTGTLVNEFIATKALGNWTSRNDFLDGSPHPCQARVLGSVSALGRISTRLTCRFVKNDAQELWNLVLFGAGVRSMAPADLRFLANKSACGCERREIIIDYIY